MAEIELKVELCKIAMLEIRQILESTCYYDMCRTKQDSSSASIGIERALKKSIRRTIGMERPGIMPSYQKSSKLRRQTSTSVSGCSEKDDQRSIENLEKTGILLNNTIFFNNFLSFGKPRLRDAPQIRSKWFGRASETLKGCEIVFLDPDTGPAPLSMLRKAHTKTGPKYAYPNEVRQHLDAGQSVIVVRFLRQYKGGVEAAVKDTFEILENHESIRNRGFTIEFPSGRNSTYFFASPAKSRRYSIPRDRKFDEMGGWLSLQIAFRVSSSLVGTLGPIKRPANVGLWLEIAAWPLLGDRPLRAQSNRPAGERLDFAPNGTLMLKDCHCRHRRRPA